MRHDIIKTGDADAFAAIQDRNGEVVLSYCRRCRGGEAELGPTCEPQVTANTITDEQIKELRRAGERMLSDAIELGRGTAVAFDMLLCTSNALYRNLDTSDGNGTWNHWRARCAEIWNARYGGDK